MSPQERLSCGDSRRARLRWGVHDTADESPEANADGTTPAPGALTRETISQVLDDIPPEVLEPLKTREQFFVAELLTDPKMVGATAARRAGYSDKRAKQTAYELLKEPRIKAALEAAKKARLDRLGIKQDQILTELAPLITSDVRDFEFNSKGKLQLRAGADPRAWRAVQSVKYKPAGKTEDGAPLYEVELKFWSKTEALRLAGEHFGLYKQNLDVAVNNKTGVLAVPVPLTAEQWMGIAAKQQDALTRVPEGAAPAAASAP
jgi:phage terminase small subunit